MQGARDKSSDKRMCTRGEGKLADSMKKGRALSLVVRHKQLDSTANKTLN